MTLVESFACGVPVLSAELGGMLSIVEDGKTGLFFEAGNIDQLAGKIVWAVGHETEMEEMGRNARCQYEANYTREENREHLMGIYGQLQGNPDGV